MKIVAVLDNSITEGGGFNQALNAILQLQRICKGNFSLEVFTSRKENVAYLNGFHVPAVVYSFSKLDRFLVKLSLNSWWQSFQNKVRILGAFEKKLISHGCDLVYFVTPSIHSAALQRLNYIITAWDVCHRDMPEFPEVRCFNQFLSRERFYKNYLAQAVVVLVDSECLADSISRRYGVDRERLLSMPFSPGQFVDSQLSICKKDVLVKYKLAEGYFFYPAQFWAHKNHIRILEALILLKGQGIRYEVVFAGGDQGNLPYIQWYVKQHKIEDQVHFLGFVPVEDMRGLYEGGQAVVMPTYFGPTNLPPLEAWAIGKPLIYSAQFNIQTGDAAILVDPDDAVGLASAMTSCTDDRIILALVAKGSERLQEIEVQRSASEIEFLKRLIQFKKRCACWQLL